MGADRCYCRVELIPHDVSSTWVVNVVVMVVTEVWSIGGMLDLIQQISPPSSSSFFVVVARWQEWPIGRRLGVPLVHRLVVLLGTSTKGHIALLNHRGKRILGIWLVNYRVIYRNMHGLTPKHGIAQTVLNQFKWSYSNNPWPLVSSLLTSETRWQEPY